MTRDYKPVTKLVRQLAGKKAIMFNDRLKDGSRSIKVWKWTLRNYRSAKKQLDAMGYKVTIVPRANMGWDNSGKQLYRMHVE